MISTRIATVLVIVAAAAGSAQAQTYGAPFGQQSTFYPYAARPQQPYAVEVAPNTYVIHRPARTRSHPSVTCADCGRDPGGASDADRPHQSNDPALIEELRERNDSRQTVTTSRKIVREKPVVEETTRVVDDPPRVIERRHVIEGAPPQRAEVAVETGRKAAKLDDGKPRVIHAEAEITILGPDRMSIRLIRKRGGPEAKALPGE